MCPTASALHAMPAPRVLVIPGLDGHTGLWRSVAAHALPGLRPVWFDHASDRADGGLEGLAERALQALDADTDGETPAYVCGESFGGPIALTLARHYPTRVRGLLLISTFGWYPGRLAGRIGLAAWRVLGDSVSQRVLRLSHPFTLPGALGVPFPRHVARAYLRRPLGDIRAYRAKCELALRFDARQWLHRIPHRALVLVGTRDPVVPGASGRALARYLPSASLHAVAGGHLVWCIRSGEVGALVDGWVAANEFR